MPGEQGDRPALERAPSSVLPAGVTVISIHPMYSAGQVVLAALLGGPLGGGWLMAVNYRRLGEPGKARIAIVLGVLAMAAVIAIGLVAGHKAVLWLMIVPVLVVSQLAKVLQRDAHDRHVALGGSRGSHWRAAGIGVVSLVIYFAAITGSLIVRYVATVPDKVMIGENSVFYTEGVPRAEAQRVGEELVALEHHRKDARWGVEVTRDGNRPVIAFVTTHRALSDDSIQTSYHELAEPLSRKVYGGAPVDVWLIDGMLRPRVKLSWESRPR